MNLQMCRCGSIASYDSGARESGWRGNRLPRIKQLIPRRKSRRTARGHCLTLMLIMVLRLILGRMLVWMLVMVMNRRRIRVQVRRSQWIARLVRRGNGRGLFRRPHRSLDFILSFEGRAVVRPDIHQRRCLFAGIGRHVDGFGSQSRGFKYNSSGRCKQRRGCGCCQSCRIQMGKMRRNGANGD